MREALIKYRKYSKNINQHWFLKIRRVYLFFLLILISPFFALSYFMLPSGYDDFNNANIISQIGEYQYFIDLYNNWTGRYTSSFFIVFLNPMKYNDWLTIIKFVPIVTLVLLIFSSFIFLKSLIKTKTAPFNIWIPVLIFSLIFLNQVPSVGQLIYWFTGASVYTSGLILILLLLSSIIQFSESIRFFRRIVFFVITVALVVLTIGINESVLFAVLFLLLLFVIMSIYYKSENLIFYCLIFFIGIFAAVLSLNAPGNGIRADVVPGNLDSIFSVARISKAIMHSLFFATTSIFSWINNFSLILGSIILLPFFCYLINKNQLVKRISKINPVFAFLLSIIFVAIQIFPSYLAVNDVELRIWSSTYFFFLLSWFTFLITCISKLNSIPFIFKAKYSFFFNTAFLVLLLFAGNSNINKTIFELYVRAPTYKIAFNERLKVFLASKNSNVEVKPLTSIDYKFPQILFVSELSTDTSELRNKSISKFFNLKSVKLIKN